MEGVTASVVFNILNKLVAILMKFILMHSFHEVIDKLGSLQVSSAFLSLVSDVNSLQFEICLCTYLISSIPQVINHFSLVRDVKRFGSGMR